MQHQHTETARAEQVVEYREIPGYPGYRAGSDGTLWTAWARGGKGTGKGGHTLGEWKQMRPCLTKYGYLHVHLRLRHGRVRQVSVHRLVLISFAGPGPVGSECCHGDGNRQNNALSNLRWGTRKENADDKVLHGTMATGDRSGARTCPQSRPRGEKHGNAKFSAATVRMIRDTYAAGGLTKRAVARTLGLPELAVSRVIRMITYKEEGCE